MNWDEASRIRRSASAVTPPEVLRALACDPSVTVRASLALNPALPEEVVATLLADTDARVRTIVGRHQSATAIAAKKRSRQEAVVSLTAIVADASSRARIGIATAICELADAPRDIVLRLMYDPAPLVSEPVIRCSPMLTPQDLVGLIESGPITTTIVAVARRPAIAAVVSDAIVQTSEPIAIQALISNQTAEIRSATLDALAAQSEEQADWQAPLVKRADLPASAQRMLSEFVTGDLLQTLLRRGTFEPMSASINRRAVVRPSVQAEPQEWVRHYPSEVTDLRRWTPRRLG